jgi:hypothetical protein
MMTPISITMVRLASWPLDRRTLRLAIASEEIADAVWATAGPHLLRIGHDWNPEIQRMHYRIAVGRLSSRRKRGR